MWRKYFPRFGNDEHKKRVESVFLPHIQTPCHNFSDQPVIRLIKHYYIGDEKMIDFFINKTYDNNIMYGSHI